MGPISLERSVVASRPFDKDRLMMTTREAAAQSAMAGLNALQDMPPERVLMGAAVMFATMCARCRLDPQEMHRVAMRIITAPEDGDRPTDGNIQVLRDWAGVRLMAQDVSLG